MRVETHELAFAFESELVERLRALRVPRATSVAQSLVPKLIAQVPSEAFEMKPAWEAGFFFLHGDTDEDYMRERQEELAAVHVNVKKGVPITLYLSSFGGSCESGMAFFSTIQEIRRDGRTVNCHVGGTAMSMGSIIVQACDTRTIEPYATMMIHESSDWFEGKVSHAEDRVSFNKRYDAMLNSIYAQRSGKPVSYWSEKMARRDVYLTAREAVNEGLVDKIKPLKPFGSKPKKSPEPTP